MRCAAVPLVCNTGYAKPRWPLCKVPSIRPSGILRASSASSAAGGSPEDANPAVSPVNPPVPAAPGSNGVPPAAKPSAALTSMDSDSFPDGFTSRRLLCFIGIVLAYMGLYFTRGTLTYTAPVMVADPALSFTLKDVGTLTSAFPMAYGLSKFVGGVMGAKISPTFMLAGGLAGTAFLNMLAAAPGVGLTALTVIWATNGCLQGIGAPASAALLTRWFASKERGTWWGFWNVGANVGGFLTPVLVGYLAKEYGWRYGMAVPGLFAVAISLFAFSVVRDSPEAAGYASVEPGGGNGTKAKPDIWTAFKEAVKEPGTWLLAFTYFFVYVIRQGATSWLIFYLMNAKGAPDAAAAARTVSGLELGGLMGGTLAGILSDMRIKSAMADQAATGEDAGHVGRRVQVVMGYLVATFGVLATLRTIPPDAKWLQWLTIGALGFCIYGPQMLIGLCGAELVSKSAVGASQGILGLVAYMGAANAGIPLSWVVTTYGWDGYFMALAVAAGIALCLLAPLANASSKVQRTKASAASA